MTAAQATLSGNPFGGDWTTPFGLPPFEAIRPEHFRPARCGAGGAAHPGGADRRGTSEPTFENTLAALERSGRTLKRVGGVFYNLAGAHTNDALQAIEREMAPILAKHRNAIFMNEALFRRVEALHVRRQAIGLSPRRGALSRPLSHDFRQGRCAPRAGCEVAPRGHHRAAGEPRHAVLPERPGRRESLRPRPRRRSGSRRTASLPCGRPPPRRPRSRGFPAST